jgi:hypothetical protein
MNAATHAVINGTATFPLAQGNRSFAAVFLDADGNPGSINGLPSWTLSDPTVLKPLGTPNVQLNVHALAVGTCVLNVSADDGSGQQVGGDLLVTVT